MSAADLLPSPDDIATGPEPLVRRIQAFFRQRIAAGHHAPGSRLPTVRAVAARLDTTAETVAAAYRLLAEAGLVTARPGAGTVVLPVAGGSPATTTTAAGPAMAVVPALSTPSFSQTYRRLLQIAGGEGASFASYVAAPDLLPADLPRLLRALMRREGARLFVLGPPEGDRDLRALLAAALGAGGRWLGPQQIVVTGGAQEGLSLVFRALVSPGDVVAVESPTYLGALEALTALGARVVGVPVRADGADLGELEALVAGRRPRLFYTMPSHQNPSGATLPLARRRRLLALARRHDLTIVEDGAAADLWLDAPAPPSLLALDGGGGHVVHVGTVSKSLASGLRVGFVAAPPALVEPLLRLKYVTNVHTPLLQQRLVLALLAPRRLQRHLRAVRGQYRARRDAMLAALARHLGGQARWTAPAGGFGVWLALPDGLDAADLYRLSVERGAGFAPGAVFYPGGHRHETLRLCFSAAAPPAIDAGVARLGEALRELRRRRPRPPASPAVLPL